jgi:hypothetical protein
VGFSPEVGPRSTPTLVGPSGGATPSAQGPAASLSRVRASVEPTPAPASVDEVEVMEGVVTPLPEEAGVTPMGAQAGSPHRSPTVGNTEKGPVTPCLTPSFWGP